MQFILTTTWEDGTAHLAQRLIQELTTGKNVLWLVSGGSNIKASVTAMNNISEELSRQLTVMLADERYGDVGHADSNWKQLMDAGFEANYAQMLPVLHDGLNFEKTAETYQKTATWAFADADVVIAQLGIGTDGHIAGILPHSIATEANQTAVVGYEGDDFKRITLTFPALQSCTAVYAFAFGETKRAALSALQLETLPASTQPAQILKQVPEVYIYNDQLGEQS